jgi:hypothetical protein
MRQPSNMHTMVLELGTMIEFCYGYGLNMDRFPEDFMFQQNVEGFAGLRSQLVASERARWQAEADRILIYSRFDLVRNPEGSGGAYPSTRKI